MEVGDSWIGWILACRDLQLNRYGLGIVNRKCVLFGQLRLDDLIQRACQL